MHVLKLFSMHCQALTRVPGMSVELSYQHCAHWAPFIKVETLYVCAQLELHVSQGIDKCIRHACEPVRPARASTAFTQFHQQGTSTACSFD